jgi:hypothetical protein
VAEKTFAPWFRERLRNAPWWVTALLMGLLAGLPPGIAVGTFSGVREGDVVVGLVQGSIPLLVWGLGFPSLQWWQRRRARAALGEVPEGQGEVAVRAAATGVVPADPEGSAADRRG